MDESTVTSLHQQAESLAALSSAHLTSATRQKLIANDLSVNAYPTAHGGFVYVGSPRYDIPTEADLAAVFEVAERAGIVWLRFDADSAVIDGLPVFGIPGEAL
jgi:phenylpropionate dioxygenase-like ring-hydroxylating dioxygenase large terminal subunit